jgi:hypothetical protein
MQIIPGQPARPEPDRAGALSASALHGMIIEWLCRAGMPGLH